MLRLEQISPSWIAYRGDGLSDLLDHIATVPNVSAHQTSDNYGRADFQGTGTMAQALDLARYGWPEGREKMKAGLASAALLQPAAPVPVTSYDIAGAFPDVGLFCAGDPACMVSYDEQDAKARPIYRIIVNISYMAAVEPQTIINRGAAILSFIDKLESEGARVELLAHRSAEKEGKTMSLAFPIKRADEPLDIDRVAFVLANPAMLRRIAWAITERNRTLCSWFGAHRYRSSDAMPKSWVEPHSIYFGALHDHDNATYCTIARAMAAVGQTIQRGIINAG